MEFDLVLWDFDGTLCNSQRTITESLRHTYHSHHGRHPEDDRLTRAVGQALGIHETLASLLDIPLAETAPKVTEYRDHYRLIAPQYEKLFDGVTEVLSQCSKAELVSAIVSHKSSTLIASSLERFGISSHFSAIFGSDAHLPSKPDPSLFHRHIAPLFPDVPVSRILFVGDSDQDHLFALRSGLPFCWAEYGFGKIDHNQVSEHHTYRLHVADGVHKLTEIIFGQ